MDRASILGGAATRAAARVTETAAAAATQGAAAAKEARHTVSAAARAKSDEFKREARTWLLEVIYDYVDKLIARGPSIMKNALDDPDMPACVKRIQDSIIDKAWPDIREEIMWEVAVKLDGKRQPKDDDLSPGPSCGFLRYMRYHVYPCDKCIWGKLRDPAWIVFRIGSLIPVSGFYALVYAVIFAIIDRSDEFQLLQFILQFKGTQFISHGVIRTIMGFFMFVNCVSASAKEEEHSCETHGPGTAEFYRGMYEFAIFGWMLQVALMWAAYFCLRVSIEKGRSELKGRAGSDAASTDGQATDPSQSDQNARQFPHTGASSPGGYVRYFLLYDAACFICIVCGLFIVIAIRPEGIGRAYNHWSIRHAFFTAQVLYGYLSMPFFVFLIPVLQRFLTHSFATAYDQKGRCVAWVGPRKKKDQDEDEQLNRWGSIFDPRNLNQATAGVALNAKLEALYDKVKDIMTNIPKVPSDRPGRHSPIGANEVSELPRE